MLHETVLDGHILNIIQNHEIKEQAELQKMLQQRGYDIPQATISRRLKKLNIAKIGGVYKVVEIQQMHIPIVLNMQVSEFGMIVLHTHPGNAHALAYYIDKKYVSFGQYQEEESGILGTIAGDDTILIVIKNRKIFDQVVENLLLDFPYIRH